MIKALIFDFGGVIINMRHDVHAQLEEEHGIRKRAIIETLYASDTWRQLEVGVGSRDTWMAGAHAALETAAGKPLPPLHRQWLGKWHLIEPNLDVIRRARPAYRTTILSNADSTLAERLREPYGIHDLFDDVVVSAAVGLAKPDPRIYALAAERLALPPRECVFIDDLENNITAAEQAGMHAVHFRVERGDNLAAQLAALGVEIPRPS